MMRKKKKKVKEMPHLKGTKSADLSLEDDKGVISRAEKGTKGMGKGTKGMGKVTKGMGEGTKGMGEVTKATQDALEEKEEAVVLSKDESKSELKMASNDAGKAIKVTFWLCFCVPWL